MAKKKVEAAKDEDFTDRLYREVTKDFGEGVIIDGTEAIQEVRTRIPICPTLDIITSGGIEEGSWVGITGNAKTTKTTSALSFAANCQKPEYGSRPIYYGKVEGRLSTVHLKGIQGLDLSRGKFNIIQSVEGKILTAQDHLRIYENILRNVPNAILIVDSISALCDEREMIGGVGTETRGSGAKLTSQWLNTMSNVVPVNKSIVIGVTHLMCNTSGMGAMYVEKATRRWHYQCDYQLRTQVKTAWKVGNSQIGLIIKWICNTSSLGPPGMSIETYFRFGTGLDRIFEIMNLATSIGLIRQAGAWVTFDFVDPQSPPKYNGSQKGYQALLGNPEWVKTLEAKVMGMAGCLMEGGE